MELNPNKQAVVDALYLILRTRGYASSDYIREVLGSIASEDVRHAIEALENYEEGVERKRKAALDARTQAEMAISE